MYNFTFFKVIIIILLIYFIYRYIYNKLNKYFSSNGNKYI